MDSTLKYIENDHKCRTVIMELRGNITVPKWIDIHAVLFKSICIQPEGRPSIASSHCGGVHYEWISNFHHLYKALLKYMVMEEED
jgi:hypothetical protein